MGCGDCADSFERLTRMETLMAEVVVTIDNLGRRIRELEAK